MSKNTLLQRNIIFVVILLLLVSSVTATLGKDTVEKTVSFVTCESIIVTSSVNKGSLSGYVKDSSMDPIEGARVRVHFHGTYEEDYTDSSGYYHVTNIPICYCLKNTTATKLGYTSKWVLLAIDEDTTYDFILKSANAYNGSLSGYVKDSSMDPIEGARVRVHFHGTYEEDYTDSSGYYHVTNIPICYCMKNCTACKKGYKTAWVLLAIDENTTHDFVLSKNKPFNFNFPLLTWLLDRFPHAFPLLRHLMEIL
jgi:hypothetical protein